jgi:hypothetical protein
VFPDGEGVCPTTADDTTGCTYNNAFNFDATANVDDGSCLFAGCQVPGFGNYNAFANVNDGMCSNGPESADFTGDGSVQLDDMLEFLVTFGTNGPDWGIPWVQNACEVEAMGLVELGVSLSGCTYPKASNYDSAATSDAGTCVWLGCTDETALNYNALATVEDSSCTYQSCPDLNGDGQVQTSDLLDFLTSWGFVDD